jgi:lanosterol synthase
MVTTRSASGVVKSNGTSTAPATPDARSLAKKRKTETTLDNEDSKRAKAQGTIDKARWRCLDEDGRLTWRYLEDEEAAKEWPQTYADKWYLGLDLVRCFSIPDTLHLYSLVLSKS